MWNQSYNQMGIMIRFIIRRDRIRIPIWIISITLLTLATASSFTGLYGNEQERQAVAVTMENPAMIAMVGPGYGLENYTIGAMMAHQMLLFTAVVVAIMNIMLVARHTRADEEEGRIELIRSLPVGKLANVGAALLVLTITNILLALVIGFGLYGMGIESMDLQGSLLYGVTLGVTGLLFMAITAFFAQASENARGTIGFSFAVLGITYLIRAVGDVSNEALSMISPLGWILRTEVYVNNYWWPIILTGIVTVVILAFALYLNTIRDLGSGFIPSRPGRKHASRFLQSPFGLALKLQRTSIITWAIGMYVLGASYGSVFGDLEAFFTGNEMLAEMLTSIEGISITEQFITMLMAVISMICTVPALMFVLKLRSEEKKHFTEHLLSRAVSRTRLLGSYVSVSIIFGFLMLFVAFIGLWSAASAVMDDAISFSVMFEAAMVYLPAMWLMVGLAVFLIGCFPKLTNVAYLYLGYSFLVVYMGQLLQFPEWMGKLSPFGHVPQLPVEEFNLVTVLGLTALAIFLMIIGFLGYKKRDITG